MKWRWILVGVAAFCATFALSPRAQAQPFAQAELEGLLAPVALHPDALLWNVLDASTEPQQVLDAAEWSRANPGLAGEAAVDAVQGYPWHPAVKALTAYPDLLARMAESPQWLLDLGNAYLARRQEVLATVQALRQRAYAGGHLQSDATQVVQHYGGVIAVAPVVSHFYVVRHYDPFVVFGPSFHGHHFHARPKVVHKHVHVPPRPVHAHPPKQVHVPKKDFRNGPPSPAALMQRRMAEQIRQAHGAARPQARHSPAPQVRRGPEWRPFQRVPESRRAPIVPHRGQHRGRR